MTVQVKVPVENMLGKENEGIKVIREFLGVLTRIYTDAQIKQSQTST
jgi:alkylation response protein AidB-like acyl-CoA dehydrogenase